MSESMGSGVVLGFGGTNARYGVAHEGDISGFDFIATPSRPDEFFGWMARKVFDAADAGHEWLVAGFPGPVSANGQFVGPMINVNGLDNQRYDLGQELTNSDEAIPSLVSQGFSILAVNDGELAAQAAAHYTNGDYDKVAALIVGTGVGTGVVARDARQTEVYRADKSLPLEIGHILEAVSPDLVSFEDLISGPALKKRFGIEPKDLPLTSPAWEEVGVIIGRLASILGLMLGVDVVVPTGSVGVKSFDKYWPYLHEFNAKIKSLGNINQEKFMPEFVDIEPEIADEFELLGGEGVMRDHQSRNP